MPTRRQRLGLAIAAAGLAIGIWILVTGESPLPAPTEASTPPSNEAAKIVSSQGAEAQRLPAQHELAWMIVDDRGLPIAGATSTVGTLELTSDSAGQTKLEADAPQIEVVAAAPQHTSVAATVKLPGPNVVTLQRVLPITVRAIDAADRPVRDVEVWITRSKLSPSTGAADEKIRTARTGRDGSAVLESVWPGTWLLDARHEDLVYSREAQAGWGGAIGNYEGIAVFTPKEQTVTIRLVEPCVIAVEVDGGDMLSCGTRRRGGAMHGPSNPGGQADLEAKRAKLQAAHPKASIFINLLSYPSVDLNTIEVGATIWVAGRRPWQGSLRPVLLRDFVAPVRISLTDMIESSDFGSVLIHLVSASGQVLTDVPMQLIAADMASPLFLTGDTPFNCEQKAVPGKLITLPLGSWRLHMTNPFLQRRADELGAIRIDSGSLREIKIGSDCEWARCHLRADDGAPPAVGTFSITHLDSGTTVTQMVNDIRDGAQMWLPVGRIRLEITARRLGLGAEDQGLLQGKAEGAILATAEAQRLIAPVASQPK